MVVGVVVLLVESIVYLNSRTLQSGNRDIVPESDRCRDVACSRMHRWVGLEHYIMRLRLMDASDELAVIELDSAEALAEVLSHIQSEYGERLQTAASLQVHMWYNQAWWNLSDDLSQFFTWIIEAGTATVDETRAFAAAPLSRPEWLFEAARQMQKMLVVATEGSPVDAPTRRW